jgi:AraC-like DNA-binding protein
MVVKPILQYDRLRLARGLIERDYHTPLTLERISGEAGFSPYHFIRLFRAAYRKTPHQYLIEQRIARAKDLLRGGDMPITEICFTVGFESIGSFSSLFRRVTGLSPSTYRKYAPKPTNGQPMYIPLCHRVARGIESDEA